MKNKIGIIVPVRSNKNPSRVAGLQTLIDSWVTTTSGFSDLIIVMDEDEAEFYLHNLRLDHNEYYSPQFMVGENRKLAQKLNDIAYSIREDYDIIGFLSDDFKIATIGWEREIVKWQEENRGVCWGNDLLQGESLCTHVFIHSSIIKALEYMTLPRLKHYYIDNYWKELGHLIGKLKYFPDLIFEHKHHSNGKNQKDSVYLQTELLMVKDKEAFDAWRETGFNEFDASMVKQYQSKHYGAE